MTKLSRCGNMFVYVKIIEADYEDSIEKGVSIEVFFRAHLENLPASMGAPFFIGELKRGIDAKTLLLD